VATAPLNLVYVGDPDRGGSGDNTLYSAGFIGQNVYLFCASEGLGTVIRGLVDRAALAKALKLRPGQRITLAQTVGYPAKK
jgi:nitroreductase